MDLRLKRTSFEECGIFGVLSSQDGSCIVATTLEHAYAGSQEPVSFIPKVPPGVYKCVRGQHQLAHMTEPFETFEITDVPGHNHILFHVGNTNNDSEGCVLLGCARVSNSVVSSRTAFVNFMQLQHGIDEFSLVVE